MAYVDEFKNNEDGTVTRTRLYIKKDGTPYKSKEKTFYKDKPKLEKSHIPTGFIFAGKSILMGFLVFLIVALISRVTQGKPIPTFQSFIQYLQVVSNTKNPFDSWFIDTSSLPNWISWLASIWNIIVWVNKGMLTLSAWALSVVAWILF